jgi:hypothetical protein
MKRRRGEEEKKGPEQPARPARSQDRKTAKQKEY